MEYRMQFDKAYNRIEFYRFLDGFLPDDFVHEDNLSMAIKSKMNYATKVDKLGYSKSLDLVVYEIKHQSKHDARVGLSKDAFRFLADADEDRALVVFVPEDSNANYRFSYIEISLGVKPSGKLTRSYSNPHRFSYYLGEGIAYYTPNKYLNELGKVKDVSDLKDRFSVEVLTKEFYQELSDWYAWAIQIIKFPNDIKDLNDDKKYNYEGGIRLITRLIFIWFLKQRRLVPKEFFDENYIAENLLKAFQPNLKTGFFGDKSLESKYYKAILQNLFFAMLNSPITAEDDKNHFERRFRTPKSDRDNNKLMRYEKYFKSPQNFVELANQVPFLNGGLFDCLDDKDNGIYYDGFSDRDDVQKSLCVPDYLFFGEEAGKNIDLSEWYGDKNKKKVSARGIIDILKRYNFTVEENTPFDQDVSLDPELLGKVFENLLASYNPETQTTARKQTGSFYTPREIVQYMVDESLVAHLKRTVGEELESEYRKLIQYNDESLNLTDKDKNKIIESLYHCKVLDPACGSGAFPVGMLQQMVHILNQVDPDNEKWKNMMLNQAVDESKEVFKLASKEEREDILKDINRSFDESINGPDYARKLYLIENCIYGVDIQPIAIQISKLRFFISLVIDQKTNNNPKENYGIHPLPNLEAKFVAANTLVQLENKNPSLFDSEDVRIKQNELKLANHKIFGAKTVKTKRKYKQKLKDIRQDIVDLLKNKGAIGNKEALQLIEWDMFDQNNHADFFDTEWMFDIKDGFDIIICNPPYLKERDHAIFFEPVINTEWGNKYHVGRMDFWYYFMHKAIEVSRDKAIICFITSRYWIKNAGAKKIIKHIKNKLKFIQIIDFGKLKIFDSVIGQHLISLLEKNETNNIVCVYKRVVDNIKNLNISKFEECRYIDNNDLISNNYEINIEENKINNTGILTSPLSTNFEVSQGVIEANAKISSKMYNKYPQSSFNVGDGVFVLTKKELEKLSLNDIEYKNCIVKYLTDNGIHKYYLDKDKTQYLIYADKRNRDLIALNKNNQYIHLKNHLDRFVHYITSDYAPYGLHRPRKINAFKSSKILGPSMFEHPSFTFDNEGFFVGMSYNLINAKYNEESLYYVLGILNSKYAEYWFYKNAKHRGVGVDVGVARLESFPIPINYKEQEYKSMIGYVNNILDYGFNDLISKKIDNIVYHLYGLSYEEVLIIDPKTPISKEEYENYK